MSKFTVEEINFMCVLETQDRTDMIGQIRQVMPHIKDSDMEELGEQVLGTRQAAPFRYPLCAALPGYAVQ